MTHIGGGNSEFVTAVEFHIASQPYPPLQSKIQVKEERRAALCQSPRATFALNPDAERFDYYTKVIKRRKRGDKNAVFRGKREAARRARSHGDALATASATSETSA